MKRLTKDVLEGLSMMASSVSAGTCGDVIGHPVGCSGCVEDRQLRKATEWLFEFIDTREERAARRVTSHPSVRPRKESR